jgi:hypothetical protein
LPKPPNGERKKISDAHGFAIVKGVLQDEQVAALKAAVIHAIDPDGKLGPGESRTHTSFVEEVAPMWDLLDCESFMHIHRTLVGSDRLTIHRSAAILRKPGSAPVAWHSD